MASAATSSAAGMGPANSSSTAVMASSRLLMGVLPSVGGRAGVKGPGQLSAPWHILGRLRAGDLDPVPGHVSRPRPAGCGRGQSAIRFWRSA
jgi:hypothetical protein